MKRLKLETIERMLKDDSWCVRASAMIAYAGREVPLNIIKRGLKDDDWRVRRAAMNACNGRDVPLDVIERGLKDSDWRVRTAAMNACNGRDVPLIHTFEPPEKVYKKCVGGVIVIATIPADAQVCGGEGRKCRTNKAKIVDIIGDLCGEKVGVSFYDNSTVYFIGDEIEVKDFDFSDEECSTGYHFFCTKEEAEAYRG